MSTTKNKRAVTGLILVLIGALFLFDNLGYGFDIPRWVFTWPMVFMGISIINIFTGNFRVALIFLAIGAFFYLQYFDLVDMRTYWPVFLIIIGLSFLLRNRERRKMSQSDEKYFDEVSIFGGSEKKFISDQLEGGKVTSIFGGSEIDLRGSKAQDGAVIELFTLFGGTDLYVPSDWKINLDTVTIFGGISDSRNNIDANPTCSVKIKGFTMFGGGDIKN
jgi:predicted membrane protein